MWLYILHENPFESGYIWLSNLVCIEDECFIYLWIYKDSAFTYKD